MPLLGVCSVEFTVALSAKTNTIDCVAGVEICLPHPIKLSSDFPLIISPGSLPQEE